MSKFTLPVPIANSTNSKDDVCRQYYLCIGGVPREYGCPLGAVFNIGSGNGVDGECSDPELVSSRTKMMM